MAGALGFAPDDPRIRDAFAAGSEAGLKTPFDVGMSDTSDGAPVAAATSGGTP